MTDWEWDYNPSEKHLTEGLPVGWTRGRPALGTVVPGTRLPFSGDCT